MNKIKSTSRTGNFLKNSGAMFLYQVVLLISGFVTPKIMLTYFGSEVNGLVSSVAQFVSYLNLVEAGLSAAVIYSLYKPIADKDNNAISSIVSAAKKFYYKSGYVFLGLITLLAATYPFFVDIPNGMNHIEVIVLVFVTGVNGVMELFTLAKYRALLTADQKTYILAITSSVYVIFNVGIILLLSIFGFNITVVKTVALLAIFLRSIILIIYCKKKYPFIDYDAKPNYAALSKRWDALFQQILGIVQNASPVVILTLCTGDLKAVSIYAIYNMVASALNSLLSIFISGLSASFGEVIAQGQKETLQKAYKDFETAYYFIICIVYSVAFVMILPFINIYTSGITDVQYANPLLGFLFVLNGLTYNIKTPQGMLVLSAGLYKETRYRSLLQAVLVVVVGVILAFKFGIIGVLIGLLVSNLYRAVDLLLFIPKHVTGIPPFETLKKWVIMIINILLTFACFGAIEFEVNSYFSWIILAVIMTIICTVINTVFFILISKNEMQSLLKRLMQIVKR